MSPNGKDPTVSIITPVRNGEATLNACRASVADQSFSDWEHIFIDDGSSDGTRSLLQRFALEDRRVQLVLHDVPQGAANARNAGIQRAKGRFIAFLDTDDRWMPEKLKTQVTFMLSDELDFSYGAYVVAGRNEGKSKIVRPPSRLTYSDLLRGCPVGCLTVMYDRSRTGIRLFPLVRRGQDWALWLEIARENGRFGCFPGIHAVYYQNRHSLSSNKVAKLRDVWHIYRVLESQSVAQSLRWLWSHAFHVLTKKRSEKTETDLFQKGG